MGTEELMYDALLVELNKRNKERVIGVLRSFGIERVVVSFDGVGDEGQIEDCSTYRTGEEIWLPAEAEVEMEELQTSGSQAPATTMSRMELYAAIETLCYSYLDQEQRGWECEDGACGEIVLDVAENTVTLNYNQRVVITENTTYTF